MAPPSAACSRGGTSSRRCSSPGSRAAGSSRMPPRAAIAAFALGALVYALDSALFFASLERTSAPLASLLHYAHLALVVGVAALVGRERLTRRRLFALTGIFAGVALVGGAAANPDGLGILMALGSAGAYAVYILLSDRLLRDADPMALTALLTAGASTSFLVAGAAIGTLGTVGGPAGLACLGGAALVGSVFAVSSFLKGVRLVGPSTASLLVTVEVPVTIALAAFVLKQHLTPAQLAGAALVVGAILAMQLKWRRGVRLQPHPHVGSSPRGKASASPPCRLQTGQAERAEVGHLPADLRLDELGCGAECLVGGGHHHVGQQLRVVRVDCLRVDRDLDDLAAAVRLHGHHAAARGGLDDLLLRLFLRLHHLGLHLLGLLQHRVHVELRH